MFDWAAWLRRLEFTSLAALAIAALCLVIGEGAQRYAEATAPSAARLAGVDAPSSAAARNAARFNNVIDYATTGSIKGRVVVLSPCKSED